MAVGNIDLLLIRQWAFSQGKCNRTELAKKDTKYGIGRILPRDTISTIELDFKPKAHVTLCKEGKATQDSQPEPDLYTED